MKVKVVLRNPVKQSDTMDYVIQVNDSLLSRDWIVALKKLLQSGKPIEKNFCFMGFPNTSRDLDYLCNELNRAIDSINQYFTDYHIQEKVTPDQCRARDWAEDGPNHELFNKIHNHFERLQGTVWQLSDYYKIAPYEIKYSIRQLNNLCHEMENLVLSQRKAKIDPYWVRPSQITTWLNANRYELEKQHKQAFLTNGYDRVLGGVYMHWTQIGKTLYEVFRDEDAPELTDTVCESITHLKYYSGEFDVEWGNDVVRHGKMEWHNTEQDLFEAWLIKNKLDPKNADLSLGYLPLGQIDLAHSFGTTNHETIWSTLANYLDIYQIEVDGVCQKYDYCWSDANYKQQQIEQLKPGYDYHLRKEK